MMNSCEIMCLVKWAHFILFKKKMFLMKNSMGLVVV